MTKIAFRHYFLHALLSVLIPSLAYTQITGEKKFGKNRVQHRELIWSYITTPNFIIKYHDSKYDIANITATYAEAGYSRVSTLVGYKPYNKMKIMVYGSVTDLHQSNIGINEQGYKVGGQTSFVRSEIELLLLAINLTIKKPRQKYGGYTYLWYDVRRYTQGNHQNILLIKFAQLVHERCSYLYC